ncbi:MAG: hypothetical protein IJ456_02315 [Bacteroides sp.]|nr:hypothetical protein [Bacteroides sp.]
MRKLFLGVALMLGVCAAFAGNKNENESRKWDMNINMEKLGRCLNLKGGQYDEVYGINEYFTEKMRTVAHVKAEKQGQRVREAVYGNFKMMKQALNDDQYRKYVQLMNLTLKNKGLDVYMEDVAGR